MKEQLKAVLGIILRPKTTLINLPSENLYLLGLLSPLYFGITRVLRKGLLDNFIESTPIHKQIIGFFALLILGTIFIFLWAILVQAVILIFKKRLSVFKLLNIWGYSEVPRLVISLTVNFILVVLPYEVKINLFTEPPLIFSAIFGVIGFIVMIYSLFLFVFGIIVSKSEEQVFANQSLKQTEQAGHSESE